MNRDERVRRLISQAARLWMMTWLVIVVSLLVVQWVASGKV